MRTFITLLALSLAGCAVNAERDESEAASAEAAGALSTYGEKLVGTFVTTTSAFDFDKITLKSDGTYVSTKTIYCITTPCDPLKDEGKFIGYKPVAGSFLGGLRLVSKKGKSVYYRVSLGSANKSFKLSRDGGKTFVAFNAEKPACDYTSKTKHYIGTSLEACMVIRYACAEGLTPFSDACGCGCEGVAKPSCKPQGCSGQICSDKEGLMTTCEWRESYACYQKLGICERGADGTCGWRSTNELEACLESSL